MRPQKVVAVGPPISLPLAAGVAAQQQARVDVHCSWCSFYYLFFSPHKTPHRSVEKNQLSASPKTFFTLFYTLLIVRIILFVMNLFI